MTSELLALAWTLGLTAVYVASATLARNREAGLMQNLSNRDQETVPVGVLTGRLRRAQANLYESLPLYIGAIVIAGLAGRHTAQTQLGAWLFFLARAIYLPVYAFGIPYVRTLVWAAGLAGIGILLVGALTGG